MGERKKTQYIQLIGGAIGIFLLTMLTSSCAPSGVCVWADREGHAGREYYIDREYRTEETDALFKEEFFDVEGADFVDGPFNATSARVNISGGIIEGNVAENMDGVEETIGGGGIFLNAGVDAQISEDVIIRENIAMDGGGIFTADESYQNLAIESEVTFSENVAIAGWWIYDQVNPPINTIEQIETRSMSTIADLPTAFSIDLRHPLNNNDINYRTEYTITIRYMERSGESLTPLQVSDNNGNLENKPNVYNQISAPLRRYEPDARLIHLDECNTTMRLTGWIDGDEAEVVYRESNPATRPVLNYIHTDRTLTLIYEEISIPRPPARPGLSSRPNPSNRPGTPNRPASPGGSNNQNQIVPPGQSDTDPDYGNYEFIKLPDVKRVRPGQVVSYTFADFGNNWGVPLEDFTIIDRPDRGLDIIAVRLPAFAEGRGVFYSIYYYTRSGGLRQHTLAENISASRAFSSSLPELGSGDYITMLSIEFGTVPPGFAVGDTLEMDFRVWDRPPARQLNNIGILAYRIDGRYREFVTGGLTGTVFLGGWFTSPQTGDIAWEQWNLWASVSLFVMLLLSTEKRVKKPETVN